MARVRDRTEDFKEASRVAALSHGYSEAQLAALMTSFIMHKSSPKSSFTKSSIKTLESIKELESFLVKHKKDYKDLHRTTEQERDNIEHEVGNFVKACKEQIDILQNRIHEEEENRKTKTWLRLSNSSHVDLVAHKHGVVLILSERLNSVTSQFDRLRSERFQDAINRATPRRKVRRKIEAKPVELSVDELPQIAEAETSTRATVRVQEQLLDDETRSLQIELSSMLDAVEETERKMMEMSALNHLISTHVQQQAQQIEQLYLQAVEATNNVEKGNKELSQAIQRNSSSRTFLLLFFIVLTVSVLFLDWYS
ncbi:Syntaxin-81 [Carex littledalei]|uniref:Syntaxin-81 n=1 Tax=Carex littledalei TaxID=544730 RepID=A0A833RC46_9POAL|nr:Syntaxin-81 [Carex littledalei]